IKNKKLLHEEKSYNLKLIKDPTDLDTEGKQVIKMLFGETAQVGSQADLSELQNKLSKGVKQLKSDTAKDLTARGYFSNNPATASVRYYTAGIILLVVGFFILFTHFLAAFGVGLILSGIIVLIF